MVARTRFGAAQANVGAWNGQWPFKSLQTPGVNGGGGAASDVNADYLTDLFGNIIAAASDFNGGPTQTERFTPDATINYRHFVRWCEYPANRYHDTVSMTVNGNPLDSYDNRCATMLEKFTVAPNKRTAHDVLCGQEVPTTGYGGLKMIQFSDEDSDQTPTLVINSEDVAQSTKTLFPLTRTPYADGVYTSFVNGTYSPGLDTQFQVVREAKSFVGGPQTPKPIQAPLEIWNKIRFWFNDDVRLSVPSVSIPYGQRYITIQTASVNDMLFEVPAVLACWANGVQFGLLAKNDLAAARQVGYLYELTDIARTPLNGIASVGVTNNELYINNIFVNADIHTIYINRIGFSLIRVYRNQLSTVSTTNISVLLTSIKWPVEYMYVGLQPTFNRSSANPNKWRDWHRYTRQIVSVANDNYSESGIGAATSRRFTDPAGGDVLWSSLTTIDSLSITSHGIKLFDNFSEMFFNSYMPYHYGGANITAPEDKGVLFVNLALFPRNYQPSGHFNFSRARETYIDIASKYCTSKTPCDLLVQVVCINFILYAEGSASLRYTT